MNTYKPEFMGKLLPANNAAAMSNFLQNQYESFNMIYDVCKEYTSGINGISIVDNPKQQLMPSSYDRLSVNGKDIASGSSAVNNINNSNLTVKIDAGQDTLNSIRCAVDGSALLLMTNNIISASAH